jgi:hypothetical protein
VGARTINLGGPDGQVYVFLRPTGGWSGTLNESARLDASGLGERFVLGASVAFAGDSIVSTSAVVTNVLFVFNKPVSGWAGTVLPSAFAYCSLNGGYLSSLAGSGDVIIAGSPADNLGSLQQAGKAFVWVKPGGGWSGFVSNAAELLPSAPIDNGEFGEAVAIDGTTALVTNRYPDSDFPPTPNKSKGYVFEKPFAGWAGTLTENAQLIGSDVINGEQFGTAASMSGDTMIIGALGADFRQGQPFGAAYVFDRPSSGWSGTVSETTELTGPQGGTDPADWFGYSVAISGNTILVGAILENVGGNVAQGAAHVFELRRLFVARARFLVKGPVRVAPGVPVEFPFRVEALPGAPVAPSGRSCLRRRRPRAAGPDSLALRSGMHALTFPNAACTTSARLTRETPTSPQARSPLVVFVGRAGGGR